MGISKTRVLSISLSGFRVYTSQVQGVGFIHPRILTRLVEQLSYIPEDVDYYQRDSENGTPNFQKLLVVPTW